MKFQRKQVVIVAALLGVAMAVVAKLSAGKVSAKQNIAENTRTAAVVLAKRMPIVNAVNLSGEFHPFQQVDVHAKVAGYIKQIYVDVGDQVKTGQTLAVLEVPELKAQVTGAKADIRRCQDSIRRAQSELERSESEYSAYHAAYSRLKQASEARPGLIAEQELDDSLAKNKGTGAQVESSRAALSEAQSQLSSAQANLDRLEAMEGYARITAPFSGVVTKRYADTGALIQAGTASDTQSMPVVQLAEWSLLRLVVPVPESAVPQLVQGSVVQVHVSALDRNFDGKVARLADALSDETRTMHTEIDVENPSGSLKEGMYAEVRVVLHREKDALSVPVQAIDRAGSSPSVMVVDSAGHIQSRPVKLGIETSSRVEILSGLSESTRVVVGNRGAFHPGESVNTKEVPDNGDPTGDSL